MAPWSHHSARRDSALGRTCRNRPTRRGPSPRLVGAGHCSMCWRPTSRGSRAPRFAAGPPESAPCVRRTRETLEPKSVVRGSLSFCGGWGIRTPEGLHPTAFPRRRHRPLGESSWQQRLREYPRMARRPNPRGPAPQRGAAARGGPIRPGAWPSARLPGRPLVRRYLAELPQGRKAARVGELWRVHGGSFVSALSLRATEARHGGAQRCPVTSGAGAQS